VSARLPAGVSARLPGRQRGIAVLTAILVVAIATVLAVNLLWRTGVNLRRTETLLLQDQARQYDLAGEDYAKYWLARDAREGGTNGIDTLQDDWARPVAFELEGGSILGQLEDQQGRFNLNALIDEQGKRVPEIAEQYERLLALLPLERPLDPGTDRTLVETTIDWIDPDQIPELEGAEDDRYTSRIPPYRPGNFWFTSTSELLAIEGYTAEIYVALQPYVAALPPSGSGSLPLNVNTAKDLVLASLINGLTVDDIPPDRAYETVTDFTSEFTQGRDQVSPKIPLDVKSSWFLLTATASIGSVQSTMYSLLERKGETVRTRLRSYDAN
jgi:general secretion pathway protein K